MTDSRKFMIMSVMKMKQILHKCSGTSTKHGEVHKLISRCHNTYFGLKYLFISVNTGQICYKQERGGGEGGYLRGVC